MGVWTSTLCTYYFVWNVDKKPVKGYYLQRNHIWLRKSLGIDGGYEKLDTFLLCLCVFPVGSSFGQCCSEVSRQESCQPLWSLLCSYNVLEKDSGMLLHHENTRLLLLNIKLVSGWAYKKDSFFHEFKKQEFFHVIFISVSFTMGGWQVSWRSASTLV